MEPVQRFFKIEDEFKLNLIRDNSKIIDTSGTYTLEFREAFCIKQKKPTLNHGLKGSFSTDGLNMA